MREIKFKGKRMDNGEWVFGNFIHISGRYETFISKSFSCTSCSAFIINPDTVSQFTGLKDKNGREIWENDIVKAPLLDPIFGDILADAWCNAEIRFKNGSFVVSYYGNRHNIYLQDLCDKIETIGNIYDNPELLENDRK